MVIPEKINNDCRVSAYISPEQHAQLMQLYLKSGCRSISQYVSNILIKHLEENNENNLR